MSVPLDTSFLLAVMSVRDADHDIARAAMRELVGNRIVAAPVLPEVFYMLARRASYKSAIKLFESLRGSAFDVEALSAEDMARMQAIMTQYQDNYFDFVDTAIMALSERLNIKEVYTLDRRDFSIFRPKHCPHLRLLP